MATTQDLKEPASSAGPVTGLSDRELVRALLRDPRDGVARVEAARRGWLPAMLRRERLRTENRVLVERLERTAAEHERRARVAREVLDWLRLEGERLEHERRCAEGHVWLGYGRRGEQCPWSRPRSPLRAGCDVRWPVAGAAAASAVLALPVGIVLALTLPAGHFTQDAMTELWVRSGGSTESTDVSGVGPVPDPIIAGAVGMAESGGDSNIVNSIGAGGLMQIHPPEPDYLDPGVNMHIAVRKFDASTRDTGVGWSPWEAWTGHDGHGDDGDWRAYLGQGKDTGYLGQGKDTGATLVPCAAPDGGHEVALGAGPWLADVPGVPGAVRRADHPGRRGADPPLRRSRQLVHRAAAAAGRPRSCSPASGVAGNTSGSRHVCGGGLEGALTGPGPSSRDGTCRSRVSGMLRIRQQWLTLTLQAAQRCSTAARVPTLRGGVNWRPSSVQRHRLPGSLQRRRSR